MRNAYEKRLMRVLKYIHDNPAGDLSLDTLAEVAARVGYPSAQSFTRAFGVAYGMSPGTFR